MAEYELGPWKRNHFQISLGDDGGTVLLNGQDVTEMVTAIEIRGLVSGFPLSCIGPHGVSVILTCRGTADIEGLGFVRQKKWPAELEEVGDGDL